jgi:hypothetical protein
LALGAADAPSGEVVPDYYLYLLDRSRGIVGRVDLEGCSGDDHARDLAAATPHNGGIELWQGDRLVETFDDRKT